MSYILDALRKADAERERDPSRGIHAQPGALPPRAGGTRGAAWPWISGGAALAVVAAAALFWRPGGTGPTPAPAVAAVPAPPPVTAPAVAAAPTPAAPPAA